MGLTLLFSTCGVWLFAYSVQMLNFTRGPIPWYSAWAWFRPVTLVLSTLAPVVFVGYHTALLSGTLEMVACDWAGASFYVLTGAMLLIDEGTGIALATACSLGNAFVLLVRTILVINEPGAREGTSGILGLVLMVIAFGGYSALGLFLRKVKRSTEVVHSSDAAAGRPR
jgi:hypothetical protein